MKIAFYRYSLLNRGGDRMVIEYANFLAQQGVAITFYTSVVNTVFTLHPDIAIRRLSVGGKLGFVLWGGLRKFNQEDLVIIDIIHLAPLLGFRNPLLYFAQADDVEYSDKKFVRWLVDRFYRWYFKREGVAISVSQVLTNSLVRRYHASKCFTVTNGIDLENFFPDPDADLVAATDGRKALFFMMRGDRFRKGIDLGLEVLRQLGERPEVVKNLEVWIGGEHLDPSASGLKITNFGVVSDDRLRQLLSSAHIFFYPSRHEGFGLFPLEAMACGCAVVTTDAIPYARDFPVIRRAPIGDVSALVREIASLVQTPSSLEDLRREGLAVSQTFDLLESKQAFEAAVVDCLKSLRTR